MNASNRFGMETIARQHQAEVSKELATRHLLKESKGNMSARVKSQQMFLRLSPVVVLTALLLYFLH
jgi:ribulose-5-phosphate 4-epimerase/fuculose-1-phosphate aldolase